MKRMILSYIAGITALVAMTMLAASCVNGQPIFQSVGETVEKELTIPEFNKIVNNSFVDVVYTNAPVSAKLSAPEEVIPLIYVTVKDSTLTIKVDNNYNIMTKQSPMLIVSSQSLKSIESHGSGDVTLTNVIGPNLVLNTGGSGDFVLSKAAADELKVVTEGSGDVTLSEIEATNAMLSSMGSGDISVRNLKNKEITVCTMGSGDVVLGSIDCGILHMDSKGSGDMLANGRCGLAIVSSFGSGDIIINNLEYKELKSTIKGSGDLIK